MKKFGHKIHFYFLAVEAGCYGDKIASSLCMREVVGSILSRDNALLFGFVSHFLLHVYSCP